MSAHEGHDHPNTKAARAKCRRAGNATPADFSDRIHREAKEAKKNCAHEDVRRKKHANAHSGDSKYHYVCRGCGKTSVSAFGNRGAVRGEPGASTGRKVTRPINTALPHAYDEDMERPGRCYVCQLTRQAAIHSEGPRDLSELFSFTRR